MELGLKLFLIEEIEEAQESNGPPEILDLIDFQGITEKNAEIEMIGNFVVKFMLQFQTISLVIQLGGWDMVLGVQWLKELGLILWDFAALTIEFNLKGSKDMLSGLKVQELEIDYGPVFLKELRRA